MNIFFLDADPQKSAQYHCDKHVVKMIVEYAQLLSTAHRVYDGEAVNPVLYRATHVNHPCGVWVRECAGNYLYLYRLFCELAGEYRHRYKKEHSTFTKLGVILAEPPANIPQNREVNYASIPLCMPQEYITGNYVESYRSFYKNGKAKAFLLTWKHRETPDFMKL